MRPTSWAAGSGPLYYDDPDAEAGDVTGQGVQGVWWVVVPDGARTTAAGSSARLPMAGC
jgi:hypothetical protein